MTQMNYSECQNDNVSMNQNFGYSSRLSYDESTYQDRLEESIKPLYYRMNENHIYNSRACLSTFGPRSGYKGYGVSMPVDNQPAVTQTPEMVNVESILTNRNVNTSKNRRNQVNPIDVTKFRVKHPRTCNEHLNPMATKLSHPSATWRECSVNRFVDLPKNPQKVIHWDKAENTKLNAKDNFIQEIPKMWNVNTALPHEIKKGKKNNCRNTKICPIGDNSVDYKYKN